MVAASRSGDLSFSSREKKLVKFDRKTHVVEGNRFSLSPGFTSLQDDDTKHTPRHAMRWFRSQQILASEWPSQTPDPFELFSTKSISRWIQGWRQMHFVLQIYNIALLYVALSNKNLIKYQEGWGVIIFVRCCANVCCMLTLLIRIAVCIFHPNLSSPLLTDYCWNRS